MIRFVHTARGDGDHMLSDDQLADLREKIEQGNGAVGKEKLARVNKLYVRDRISILLDEDSFVEDGLFANVLSESLPADGVVTGVGKIEGKAVAIMANDTTVKAGSWGARTVEKIIRITETALQLEIPIIYLVDSAGARITDQVELFPGRRGAGKIFYNQVKLSGKVPQICCLFGPSAAGGAYIPAFCDVVFMVENNASMYLGSPRMAEMVIGEKTTLEEMGGARMHASVSGCGDNLFASDEDAIEAAREYLSYFPSSFRDQPPLYMSEDPKVVLQSSMIPLDSLQGYDVHSIIEALIDYESFFEIKPLFAPEIVVGFARLDGRSIGVIANNPSVKAGVLFGDSADKAARFVWLCDAFNIPLLFLADVPGFMIGTEVERAGIIRHGAKMISAVSEAQVPKLTVILRKAYGAGLYAMAGPAFGSDATIALSGAQIAVMGPEAAVNAVYANYILAINDPHERQAFIDSKQKEYLADVDLLRLASDLVIDDIVLAENLRGDLIRRFSNITTKVRVHEAKHHGVHPV